MSIKRMVAENFRVSGYVYMALHVAMHIALASVLYFIVQPDLSLDMGKLAAIALGTILVDLDHVPLWMECGILGYLKLRSTEEMGKPRPYYFHNFFLLIGSLGGSLLLMLPGIYFYIGLFSVSLGIHLVWDFAEDVFVYDTGYGHWI